MVGNLEKTTYVSLNKLKWKRKNINNADKPGSVRYPVSQCKNQPPHSPSPRNPEDDLPRTAKSRMMTYREQQNNERWLTGAWLIPAYVIWWRRKVILLNLKGGVDETSCLKSFSGDKWFRLAVSQNWPGPGKTSSGDWKITVTYLKRIALVSSNLESWTNWERRKAGAEIQLSEQLFSEKQEETFFSLELCRLKI